MRRLFLSFVVACASERAPSVTPSATVDAAVIIEPPASGTTTTAPVESAVPPPSLVEPDLPKALLERLAREAGAIPSGEMRKSPLADAERDRAIRAQFGERCRLERSCGPLWGIDCQAAVDGPYYYVRPRADGWQRITVCGGACMGGRCTNCPPKNEGWTCETY